MTKDVVLAKLRSFSSPKDVEGMARFGINPQKAFGIRIPVLRKMAKEISKDNDLARTPSGKHQLALEVWNSGFHEARILASMIDDVELVTEKQMDSWVADFDSWDVCDQCCMNLFVYTDVAKKKALEWSSRENEFEKRGGFALIACYAWKIKDAKEEIFADFFVAIVKQADDDRNFVKKAVNWALRQIGKRNMAMNKKAIRVAKEIENQDSKSAKWIAKDALKELQESKLQNRLQIKERSS